MLLLACSIWAGSVSTSGALVVGYPDRDDNVDHGSLHPSRAPMLDSVGQLGDQRRGSAVYLGSSWILTANHAFEGRASDAVIFSGKEYQLNPGRAVRLKNPASFSGAEYSDLVMVLLLTEPDLPALKISEQTPFASELVVMVGCGETAIEPGSSLILADSESQPSPLIRPISDDSSENIGRAGPRWGENEIAERGVRVGIPGREGETRAFVTIRQPYRTPHNAQGAAGDSGGGVFVKRGEQWQLAGVMLSVIHREDLNASGTFMGDLSVYREQIEATIPEPSAGLLLISAAGLLVLRRRRCA